MNRLKFCKLSEYLLPSGDFPVLVSAELISSCSIAEYFSGFVPVDARVDASFSASLNLTLDLPHSHLDVDVVSPNILVASSKIFR